MVVIKNVENIGTGLGISGMLSMGGTGGPPLICSHSRILISAPLSSILYCSPERVIRILLSGGDVSIIYTFALIKLCEIILQHSEIGFSKGIELS